MIQQPSKNLISIGDSVRGLSRYSRFIYADDLVTEKRRKGGRKMGNAEQIFIVGIMVLLIALLLTRKAGLGWIGLMIPCVLSV